jgi:hypothetical protein
MRLLIFLALALPAGYLLAQALRLLIAPRRWPLDGARWIVWGRVPERHPRPSDLEIRLWASVWASIGLVVLVLAITAVVMD